jgi:hypothetical protein
VRVHAAITIKFAEQKIHEVSRNTVKGFERDGTDPKLSTLHKWRRALEAAGIEFIDPGARSDDGGPGVRLRGTKGKR